MKYVQNRTTSLAEVVRFLSVLVAFLIACDASLVLAADLKAPFELESTQVLPPGIRNPRVKVLLMSADSRFNGFGVSEPLARRLNKTLSWGDLREAQSSVDKQKQFDGLLADCQAQGKCQGSPGQTFGDVKTLARVTVPVLAYGVTPRWTTGLAVPVYHVDVKVGTSFIDGTGHELIDSAYESSPQKAAEAAQKLADPIAQKLSRLGYQPLRSRTVDAVGDLKWVNKVLVYDDSRAQVSFKTELTLPTGRAPNADLALDVPTGDGQWDVGYGVAYSYRLIDLGGALRGTASFTHVLQMPDRLDRRLPVSETDALSADKELVSRDLGDLFSTQAGLQYDVGITGFVLGAGYSFQFLNQTTYKDGAYDSYRYRLLESEIPLQALHSAVFSLGFSTVEHFKAKRFPIPVQAQLVYSRPLQGRSVTTNSVIATELVMFF